MPVNITEHSDDEYITVNHCGVMTPIHAISTGNSSNTKNWNYDRVLADFSHANLTKIKLLDVDNIASCIKDSAPNINRIAIVKHDGCNGEHFKHAVNVYDIQGIAAKLFDDIEAARDWLLLV